MKPPELPINITFSHLPRQKQKQTQDGNVYSIVDNKVIREEKGSLMKEKVLRPILTFLCLLVPIVTVLLCILKKL